MNKKGPAAGIVEGPDAEKNTRSTRCDIEHAVARNSNMLWQEIRVQIARGCGQQLGPQWP
jgi:hypothetical protein